MRATTIIIRGTHNNEPATVTFTFIGRKIWCAKVECDGKVVDVRSKKNNGLRPCPTHAGYLLDEHFPKKKKRLAYPVRGTRANGRQFGQPSFPQLYTD